jgi:cob(I)alamin adenosyltransferase
MTVEDQDRAARDAAHNASMKALKAERDARMAEMQEGGGLLMVHTGDGKGKSTAAFGMIIRALGWGHKVAVVQFIKGNWITGERQFFRRFEDQMSFHVMGEGFTWETQDRARDVAAASAAWDVVKVLLASSDINLLVLDELNIALRYDYLDITTVLQDLAARRPGLHVCITGRNAHPELVEMADLVTEMTLVKHPFQQGFKAQRGVDF